MTVTSAARVVLGGGLLGLVAVLALGASPPARALAPEPAVAAPESKARATVPEAATATFPNGTYEQSFRAIFVMLILAVLLESSLAVLFNWRPFVETFNARAVRPVVSFVVSMAFVRMFDLDLTTKLVNIVKPGGYEPSSEGLTLTAMMLAGGSAAVNHALVGLGFRQQRTPENMAPKPPPSHGWLSVTVDRREAMGPIAVHLGTVAPPPLVAVLHGRSRRGLRYFLADPGRFPRSGGYSITAGSSVQLVLEGMKNDGSPVRVSWGPKTIAPGAIVDLEIAL